MATTGRGKEDVKSAQTVAKFARLDTERFVDFWFNGNNPSAVGMVNDWYRKSNNRTQQVEDELKGLSEKSVMAVGNYICGLMLCWDQKVSSEVSPMLLLIM